MNISLTSKMVCKLSSFFCSQLARCIFCRNFPSLRLHLQSCPLQPRTRWNGVSIGSQWEEDRRSSNMQERERGKRKWSLSLLHVRATNDLTLLQARLLVCPHPMPSSFPTGPPNVQPSPTGSYISKQYLVHGLLVTLMMEADRTSVTSVNFYRSIWAQQLRRQQCS